uniref:Uncharacterized protein n=1 Tax=Candidatus Kentrum sp. LFY TaxID=2126342 RepID=A0A450WF24_9GAMM|nr:MAG: hypothetical protein BECKLFY1418C_GA0070996_101636 [Candidatus Kentron sp. LFY]
MNSFSPAIKKALRTFHNYSGARHIIEMARFKMPNAPDYEKPPTLLL